MAMAAHFFNHFGHLGLGVVSLSGVLNSVYQQNSDKFKRHMFNSGYISNIREYIGNENTKGTIPLLKRSKNLHKNSIIDKLPEFFQTSQKEKEKVPLTPEMLMAIAVACGRQSLDKDQEQPTDELRALIKQHGFEISDILIGEQHDDGDDKDENKAQRKKENKYLLKCKSSENFRQYLRLSDRSKTSSQLTSSTSLLQRALYQNRKFIKKTNEEEQACRTLINKCKAAAVASTSMSSSPLTSTAVTTAVATKAPKV